MVKIVNNNLVNPNIIADITKAIAGSWGNIESDNASESHAGNNVITYVYGGNTIKNASKANPAMALIVDTDGSTHIEVIDAGDEKEFSYTMKMAIIFAQEKR